MKVCYKRKLVKIKNFIKDYEFKFLLFEFIKWKLIDINRKFRKKVPLHFYGIRCVTGMYGCGKTITMSKIALDYRNKYKDKIYICTNFGLKIQDFPFINLDQLTVQYDKPIIFLWDEVQNDFPATEKSFPKDVLKALTLNRKGNGKMFYWASQDFELVHKSFRRLTIEYGLVKTLWGRFTRVRWYTDYDYARLFDQNNIDKKIKIHPIRRQKFIQSDKLRKLYNSFSWDNGESIKNN